MVCNMKKFSFILICILLVSLFAVSVSAQESANEAYAAQSAEENAESTADTPAALDAIVSFFTENAAELISVLSFGASLLLAFLYKSGLLPLLRNGISALADTAGKTGKMAEDFTEKAEKDLEALKENMQPLQELLQKTESSLESLSDAILRAERAESDTRDILAAETALFYEMLSSVNLPEAQKENMSDRYYKLLKKLEDKE